LISFLKITVFSSDIEADNITNFKYVAIDSDTEKVIKTETIERIYSNNKYKSNDVFNR